MYNSQGKEDCTFSGARVQLGFQISIAKIFSAALDDKGCVYRVARHAEDERFGLGRQLFVHAPSNPNLFETTFFCALSLSSST